jgi:hypothetical protein
VIGVAEESGPGCSRPDESYPDLPRSSAVRTELRRGFQNFEVLPWDECGAEDVVVEFPDRYSALEFLSRFLWDPQSMAGIRGILGPVSLYGDVSEWSDEEVLEQFSWELVCGRFKILERPMMEMGSSGGESHREPGPPEPEVVWARAEKSWIEIELVDEADQPVAGARYRITLPDGKTLREGSTNAEGWARVSDIDPGTCQITFPFLDKEAWEPAQRSG